MPDTIAALSTPPGTGFVGIVRLSGPRAVALAGGVLAVAAGVRRRREVREVEVDLAGRACPAALWVLPGPGTYTGEDMAEFHLWGAPALTAMLLERLLAAGARAAGPGEFTRRAFLNGRMDLARAEAVLEVIHARSAEAHRLALRQLQGRLSAAISTVHEGVADLAGLIEAALDFSDQDIEVVARDRVRAETAGFGAAVGEILRRSLGGEVVDALPTVVLAGRTGAGKSSLFNRLVPDGRAIVSGLPGTTRDGRSGETEAGGRRFRLVDTAGESEAVDPVERAAIERAAEWCQGADAVVRVADGGAGPAAAERAPQEPATGRTLRVWNKADLAPAPPGWIAVSARTGAGLDALRAALARMLDGEPSGDAEAAHLLNLRQRDALRRAAAALARAEAAARADLGYEFVACDLRAALDAFGEILGRISPEDLLDRIFGRFCIGK